MTVRPLLGVSESAGVQPASNVIEAREIFELVQLYRSLSPWRRAIAIDAWRGLAAVEREEQLAPEHVDPRRS